jgi:TolA-binding protein
VLEGTAPYDQAPAAEFWPSYLRGEARLALKQPREAAAEFSRVTDHRGGAPTSPLYSLSLLGSARAAALMGDMDTARARYERLFEVWNAADADIAALKDARQEYAGIR